MKPKAGNHIYKGLEMPIHAKIITDKNGKEYYLSGRKDNVCTIKSIPEGEETEIDIKKIENKL